MSSTSHYPDAPVAEKIETHTLSVLVDNEPGVLARVIGLFSGRGYNIELADRVGDRARRSTCRASPSSPRGTPMVIEQIKNQLERLVPVHRVVDMTLAGPPIERELALVKVRGTGEHAGRGAAARRRLPRPRHRRRAPRASSSRSPARATRSSSFIDLMRPLGLVEVSRTGVVAIARGPEAM